MKTVKAHSKRRAENILKMLEMIDARPVNIRQVSQAFNISFYGASAYLRDATDANAILRIGSHCHSQWIVGSDARAIARFVARLKEEIGTEPRPEPMTAQQIRLMNAERAGRHIHYADDANQNPVPNVRPAWRDPLIAAFFGPVTVAA